LIQINSDVPVRR